MFLICLKTLEGIKIANYNDSFFSKYFDEKIDDKNPIKIDSNYSTDNSNSKELFEIFGLKLHFDDILLICLIFFLYKEGVHDEMLFIVLILLLLT